MGGMADIAAYEDLSADRFQVRAGPPPLSGGGGRPGVPLGPFAPGTNNGGVGGGAPLLNEGPYSGGAGSYDPAGVQQQQQQQRRPSSLQVIFFHTYFCAIQPMVSL